MLICRCLKACIQPAQFLAHGDCLLNYQLWYLGVCDQISISRSLGNDVVFVGADELPKASGTRKPEIPFLTYYITLDNPFQPSET